MNELATWASGEPDTLTEVLVARATRSARVNANPVPAENPVRLENVLFARVSVEAKVPRCS
jgi:hypothetical protein